MSAEYSLRGVTELIEPSGDEAFGVSCSDDLSLTRILEPQLPSLNLGTNSFIHAVACGESYGR